MSAEHSEKRALTTRIAGKFKCDRSRDERSASTLRVREGERARARAYSRTRTCSAERGCGLRAPFKYRIWSTLPATATRWDCASVTFCSLHSPRVRTIFPAICFHRLLRIFFRNRPSLAGSELEIRAEDRIWVSLSFNFDR